MITEAEEFKQIEWIMNNFDFEKVHSFMTLTKHTWFDGAADGTNGVPSIERIKDLCRYLLSKIHFDKGTRIGTGGFTVYRFPYGLELTYAFEYSRGF